MNAVLLAGHLVDEELVDAAVEDLVQPGGVLAGSDDTSTLPRDVVGPDVGRRRLELLDGLEVGHQHRVEHVRAPLLVRAGQRLVLVGRPRHLDLDADRLALAAALAEGVDDPPQLLGRCVHGDAGRRPTRRTMRRSPR